MLHFSTPMADIASPAAFDTFGEYLRIAVKQYYERGWKSRRGNLVALLIASGQAMAMAKAAISSEQGLRGMALGAAGAVALRVALRYALGGPLGMLLTAGAAASLVAYFARNQKEIAAKIGRYRELVAEERNRFEDVQTGYRQNRYDSRERDLMVEGQLKRFLDSIDNS